MIIQNKYCSKCKRIMQITEQGYYCKHCNKTIKFIKRKILFVYKHERSFVTNDYKILKKNFDVIPLSLNKLSISKLITLRELIKKCDIIFIWFASYHAFITTLLRHRKPIIIVTGGYDVAKCREINYGLLLNPIYRKMVKHVLEKAKYILPVSHFNQSEINRNLNYIRTINDFKMVYNGVDCNKFKPKDRKRKLVLTVGNVTKENWIRKGLKDFVDTAIKHDDLNFVIVGKIDNEMKELTDDYNKYCRTIYFTGYVDDKELLKWYQKSKVYCQLSKYESFGISLAESMLCKCVPVVTTNGALPELVSNTGVYADGKDDSYYHAIKKAMLMDGTKCRKHIKDNFSLEIREKKLINIINEV